VPEQQLSFRGLEGGRQNQQSSARTNEDEIITTSSALDFFSFGRGFNFDKLEVAESDEQPSSSIAQT